MLVAACETGRSSAAPDKLAVDRAKAEGPGLSAGVLREGDNVVLVVRQQADI